MSRIALQADKLSKQYRIGQLHQRNDTLRDALATALRKPFQRRQQDEESNKGRFGQPADTIWALKDVSFEINHGEVVGIIGRNGAGKSTLLKILTRITEPTAGWARLDGRVGSLLEVGTGFHPELTGRENIYYSGTVLGMKRSEINRKFDEIVDFSGVEKFIDTPVKRYSSGMNVRLGFAVAAHLEPEILLVDEVLAVGDVAFQKKCLGKMGEVAGLGRTILFVSHNMGAISSLCSQTIYLDGGKLIKKGPTEEVISIYLTESHGLSRNGTLANRAGRKGDGRARFTSFEILDANSLKPVSPVISGRDVIFKIGYRVSQAHESINDVTVGIQIFTAVGTFLTAMNSRIEHKSFRLDNGEGYVYCKLPRLSLMTGTHYVSLVMGSRGTVIDHVDQAAVLPVETGDFYNTGMMNAYGRQGLFVDYEWSETAEEFRR